MEILTPGTRIVVRHVGTGVVAESDPIDPPDHVAVEADDGGAGYVPREWVKVIES